MTLTTDELTTLIADLLVAAHQIRTRGWTVGDYWNPDTGNVCPLGAVAAAIHHRLPIVTDCYRRAGRRFSFLALDPTELERFRRVEKAANDYVYRHQLIPGIELNEHTVLGLVDWNDQVCRSGEQAAQLFEAVAAELAARSDATTLVQAGDQS
jgi:hypothetical protein